MKVLDPDGRSKALKLTLCDSESESRSFLREFETTLAADNDIGNVVKVVSRSITLFKSEEIFFGGFGTWAGSDERICSCKHFHNISRTQIS